MNGSHDDAEHTYDNVKEYYGQVLSTSKDLKTSACTAGGRPHPEIRQLLKKVPKEVSDKFYGCGAPLPLGIDGLRVSLHRPGSASHQVHSITRGCSAVLRSNAGNDLSTMSSRTIGGCTSLQGCCSTLAMLRSRSTVAQKLSIISGTTTYRASPAKVLQVLDLGSGSGRDCYLCASLVGQQGFVTGIDMTREQIEVAERHVKSYTTALGYEKPNMAYKEGHIEYLDRAGIADESVDLIISNCVLNLSPDKARVLAEAYRVLAPGGEFYFSDVYASRRLGEDVRKDKVLWGECISGALYINDFITLAKQAGFTDPRVLSSSEITISDVGMKKLVGNAEFSSVTFRLFKLPGMLEPKCEDYGQVAIYKGQIQGHESAYTLDRDHVFEQGKPALVCGNTAAMLGENGVSWLSKYFQVIGNRDSHYGEFDCGPSRSKQAPDQNKASQSSCSPSGGCC